jgi:hypothetical protein
VKRWSERFADAVDDTLPGRPLHWGALALVLFIASPLDDVLFAGLIFGFEIGLVIGTLLFGWWFFQETETGERVKRRAYGSLPGRDDIGSYATRKDR